MDIANDAQIKEALASLEGLIQRRVRLEQLRDQKTQLANLTALEETIADCLGKADCFWVAFVEIDRFKSINDKFGYEKADVLLKAVADLIKQKAATFPGKTDPFRAHGDEFYLLGVPGGTPEEQAEAIDLLLKHLCQKVSQIKIPAQDLGDMECTVSIGWLMSTDMQPGTVVRGMFSCLEIAMSESKEERNCVRRYSRERARLDIITLRADCQRCRCRFSLDLQRAENCRDQQIRCPNCGSEGARPPEPQPVVVAAPEPVVVPLPAENLELAQAQPPDD